MRRAVLLLLAGLSFATVMPALARAQTDTGTRAPARDPFGGFIADAAHRFSLPAAWIRAVIATESNGDPRATSPKGAMGLMQIMPATWAELRARQRLGSDPYDPYDNIIAGAAYIRKLLDRYGSPGWIAAYNAGPGRYEASLNGLPLPAETRAYVASIAPFIDGTDATSPVMVAMAAPPDWIRAPLFVAQPDRGPVTNLVPSNRSPNNARAAARVRDISAIEPQSTGLFVARAGTEEAP